MPIKLHPIRLINYIIKERLKHPFSYRKRHFRFSEPNLIYGLTDHPIDINGDPIHEIYKLGKKVLTKKAFSIRECRLKSHDHNIFEFDCDGYNIYLFRPVPPEVEEMYPIPKLGRKPRKLTMRLIFITPSTYRMLCAIGDEIPKHDTEMVLKDITDNSLKVDFQDVPDYYILKTSMLTVEIYKKDFKIRILNNSKELITESSGKSKNDFVTAIDSFPLGFIKVKKQKRIYGTESFVLYPGEAIYGLGEQYSSLNKVGQTITLWHYEGYGNSSGRRYKNIPLFLSTRGYGVFVNESKPITFWVGSREYCKNMMAIEGNLIDYFFFYGPDFKTILFNYTELTGKSPVPPKWSFGAWMSRISYGSQEEVLKVAERLRKEKFPFDVIHVDTDWFTKDWECDWQFSKEKFPNPKKMCEELHQMGFKLSLWQTPYVMKTVKEYKELKKLGYSAKNHGSFLFLFHPSVVIDFSNPEAVNWYQNKLRNLFEIGASVIKTDFGEGVEPHQSFLKYKGREMHNLFPILYQKAAFEVTKEFFGKGIIWARSAYAGSQIIFSPSDKLYIRWTQFSIFNSHIRYHGNPPRYREPWNYESETQNITRKMLNLRYQLLPYIYTEAHYASELGLPMMAPLILEFNEDPNVFNLEDQFMYGRNIMVAPILTETDTRLIYFPKGLWFDYWTQELYQGPTWHKYECPIDKIPVFLKEGSIVPFGPVMQYVDELPLEELTLLVIPDTNGNVEEYKMIEDEQKTVRITAKLVDATLKVEISKTYKKLKIETPKTVNLKEILVNGLKL